MKFPEILVQNQMDFTQRISGKGVHMYKGVGASFADVLSHFS